MAKYNRESILEAGITLMQSRGYAGTGVNDILKVAEIPKGSFYNFFDSKEDFVIEAVRLYGKKLEQMMIGLLEEEEGGPLLQLRHFFQSLGRLACDQEGSCFLMAIRNELLGESPLAIEAIHAAQDEHVEIIAKWLKAGQEEGEIRQEIDPEAVGRYLLTSFSGVVCAQQGRGDVDLIETFDRIVFEDFLVRS